MTIQLNDARLTALTEAMSIIKRHVHYDYHVQCRAEKPCLNPLINNANYLAIIPLINRFEKCISVEFQKTSDWNNDGNEDDPFFSADISSVIQDVPAMKQLLLFAISKVESYNKKPLHDFINELDKIKNPLVE